MTANFDAVHVCDDWISCPVADAVEAAALSRDLCANHYWLEVVPGLDSLAVQFDPEQLSIDEALAEFHRQIEQTAQENSTPPAPMIIPVCYEDDGDLDSALIANRLGIALADLPNWHSEQRYTVSMLGFMPGFAYLQSNRNLPKIGRLATPRTHVTAGSVGIIGGQCCLYSFDSPGGWPLIGRTPICLFDIQQNPPALLSPQQSVRFEPISRDEFKSLQDQARS